MSDPKRELAWYAGVIDQAASAASQYTVASELRQALGLGIYDDLPDDATDELNATCWAFTYAIDFTGNGAHLVPRHAYGDRDDPPRIKDVTEDIRQIWRQLLAIVREPAAQARLAHIVFQCGGSGGRDAADIAIDSYVTSASHWERRSDGIENLQIASRIARAIKDDARARNALELILDAAEATLSEPHPAPGHVLRALEHVVREPLCPARTDTVLERAAAELQSARDRDQALELILDRCGTDEPCRLAVWERRIDAMVTAAAASESLIMRMILHRDALNLAEASGYKDLKGRAAAALQTTREKQLELVRFESSSVLYNEEFERVRDAMIAGDSWQQALMSFANAGPLSGNYDANVENVKERRNLAPLTALMPVTLIGPDGMPIYEPISDEDRFDYDLTVFEGQIIAGLLRPLVAALHAVPQKFSVPDTAELASFLDSWPGMRRSTLPTIVGALQRFWIGDPQGATYTLVPSIEALIRELILDVNHGMYRLQRTHAPGQYPGLGAMLDLLPELFGLSPSYLRFLKVVLTHPAGFNLRNRLAHGINEYSDPGHAALVIHTVLVLATLTPPTPAAADDANGDTQG